MRIPSYLKGEARSFWKRHATRLESAGLLTDADIESFALLCRIWQMLSQLDPVVDRKDGLPFGSLLKQYQAYGKQFGLMAKDRKANKLDKPGSLAEMIKKGLQK